MSPKDKRAAKAAYHQGVALLDQEQPLEALPLFEKAYELDPHPTLMWNIARCHEKANQHDQAVRAFNRYLSLDITPQDRTEALAKVSAIQSIIDADKLATIELTLEPSDASVKLDGKPVGWAIRKRFKASPGKHMLTVTAEGYTSVERAVELSPRATVELKIVLPRPGDGLTDPTLQAQSKKRSQMRTWSLITAGSGLIGLAVGAVLTVNAGEKRDAVRKAIDGAGTGPISTMTMTTARDNEEAANTSDTVAWALYATGGALLITGAILYFTAPDKPGAKSSQAPTLQFGAMPTQGGGFVQLKGAF